MPKTRPSDIFTDFLPIPACISTNFRRILRDSTFSIYPICKLNELVSVVRKEACPLQVVRYLIDTSQQLWFAQEGGANHIIPAHYQMTGSDKSSARCLSAGNLFFSSDYQTIVGINHKSGDFTPPFDSIKLALALLVANTTTLKSLSIELAPELMVDKLTSSGGEDQTYIVEMEELTSWASAIFDLPSLSRQPTEIISVAYEGIEFISPSARLRPGRALFPRAAAASPAPSLTVKGIAPPPMKRARFLEDPSAGATGTTGSHQVIALDDSSEDGEDRAHRGIVRSTSVYG